MDSLAISNMPYSRAEELVIEVLKVTVRDLLAYTKAREKTKDPVMMSNLNRQIKEAKEYIVNGMHKEILDANPDAILQMVEEEVRKVGR